MREAVPEVEEQGYIRVLDEVYATGQPYMGRGVPVTLAVEGSERLEERILDFVFQPTGDVDGNLPGILIFGVDGRTRSAPSRRCSAQKSLPPLDGWRVPLRTRSTTLWKR